ncbi:DNA polymerase beta superfamily protein [Aeromicrobium sp. UC242_57]|uniref:nucleotidyltransferase domain-containing protein n=1 Tax=Aeromicrobium sp. UC242_57 TaxID=3374624 RepID=UPI0037909432
MRALPAAFDDRVVEPIDARLDDVAVSHRVQIPWAIESGSRAWGFPSPDSDYDCRFFFVRDAASYLSPWRPRDVIETPLDPVLDVNGWDLIKAVKLLVAGNAVALEWLRSPCIYHGDAEFRDELVELGDRIVDRQAIGRHYAHVGSHQAARHGLTGEIPLKTLFYALRPAAAVRWLVEHPEQSVPPMDLPTLLRETSVPAAVQRAVADLVARKAETRELGVGQVPGELRTYIVEALEHGVELFAERADRDESAARQEAADFFGHLVSRYGPS